MSGAGIDSVVYGRLRVLADLLDEVLIVLKGSLGPDDAGVREARVRTLAKVLADSGSQRTHDVVSQMLRLFIEEEAGIKGAELSRTAENLVDGRNRDETVSTLERIARVVEVEQARSTARARGHIL